MVTVGGEGVRDGGTVEKEKEGHETLRQGNNKRKQSLWKIAPPSCKHPPIVRREELLVGVSSISFLMS